MVNKTVEKHTFYDGVNTRLTDLPEKERRDLILLYWYTSPHDPLAIPANGPFEEEEARILNAVQQLEDMPLDELEILVNETVERKNKMLEESEDL